MPFRQQANIWPSDGLDYWCIHAWLGLIKYQCWFHLEWKILINWYLLCRDSDTLRKPKKSSSTGWVALKYFNRIYFSVHNTRCRSYHNLVYDRTVISNRQVLAIWYELVIYILNLGIWNFVYMFGMNPPDVLVGYVHRKRKSDLGRLYISRASTHASLRIFLITKACLYETLFVYVLSAYDITNKNT